jgi:hypothetical protein
MRASKRCSAWTVSSSVAPSMGWSFFSGMSLANVSCLSVLGLPVTPQDLWNGHRYLKAQIVHWKQSEQGLLLEQRLPKRMVHSMARNLSTSSITIATLIDYGLSFNKGFDFAQNSTTSKEFRKIALLGMLYEFPHLVITLRVHRR